MKQPTTHAPFVVLGGDGKEYAAQDREALSQWWGQGVLNDASKIWSTADQRWRSVRELGIRKVRKVIITTGDIPQPYRVIDVVFAFVGRDTPAFGRVDVPAALSEATDQLANSAVAIGADAVVWARYDIAANNVVGGVGFIASGTAVTTKA